MISISTWCPRAPRRAETWLACQRASCEPREPMRREQLRALVDAGVISRVVRVLPVSSFFDTPSRRPTTSHWPVNKEPNRNPIPKDSIRWRPLRFQTLPDATEIAPKTSGAHPPSTGQQPFSRDDRVWPALSWPRTDFVFFCDWVGRYFCPFHLQIEQAADHIQHGRRFGFLCRRLQCSDRGVHHFIDDA